MTFAFLAPVFSFLRGLPWQLWLVLAVLATGWFWGNARYDAGQAHERAEQERRILEAVVKAVEAERHAQAQHDKREQERHSHTRDLREAAAKAPEGGKVQGVLDALRN